MGLCWELSGQDWPIRKVQLPLSGRWASATPGADSAGAGQPCLLGAQRGASVGAASEQVCGERSLFWDVPGQSLVCKFREAWEAG